MIAKDDALTQCTEALRQKAIAALYQGDTEPAQTYFLIEAFREAPEAVQHWVLNQLESLRSFREENTTLRMERDRFALQVKELEWELLALKQPTPRAE